MVARERHDRVPRDAAEDRRSERRRVDNAVADGEDILTAAFADVSENVERDRLRVAVGERLHLAQRGVRVIRGALRRGRQRVRRHPRPGADLHVGAVFERARAEIGAPVPEDDRRVHRIWQRIDAERFVAAVDDRPDVARLHLVGANRVEHGALPAGEIERVLHPIDLHRVLEALHVGVETEAGRSARRGVAACAFEDAAAVMDHVRRDVDVRVLPLDEPAVHPDLAGAGKRHQYSSLEDSSA